MEITKSVKNIGSEIEKSIEKVGEKMTKTFDNLASHMPFANLAKKENSIFQVEVDLPGVKKEDVDIKIEDGMLVVTAIRNFKNELTEDDYYVCESSFGKMERRFTLPENIDREKVNAKLENGRLEIELVKTKEAQPKKIEIK